MLKLIRYTLLCTVLLSTSACQNSLIKLSDEASSTDELMTLKQNAAAAYNAKDFEAALPLYQELNQTIPNDAYLWLRTGNVLARLKRPAEAVSHYQQAVQRDPQLAVAWHNMAVLQLRQAANTLVQMVQHIKPDDPLYQRAVTLSDATLMILGVKRNDNQQADDQK